MPWAPIDFPDAQAPSNSSRCCGGWTRVHRTMQGRFFVEFETPAQVARAGSSRSKLKTLHDDNQRFFVPDKFSANKLGSDTSAAVSYTVDGWLREIAIHVT